MKFVSNQHRALTSRGNNIFQLYLTATYYHEKYQKTMPKICDNVLTYIVLVYVEVGTEITKSF